MAQAARPQCNTFVGRLGPRGAFHRAVLPACRENFHHEGAKDTKGFDGKGAGFVGMITANSFMKREFGKKLIEGFFPRVDLSHAIDTSGAYIPGHGTPTVILFGRDRAPVGDTVRTVMGIKGEPTNPDDPSKGVVWKAIVCQMDRPGSESTWVSVADSPRSGFVKHPWSIGGGGAVDVKEIIEAQPSRPLEKIASEIGITAVTGEDSLFLLGDRERSLRTPVEITRELVLGDSIRDWILQSDQAVWLYDDQLSLISLKHLPKTARYFWPYRASISRRKRFGTPMVERGLTWFEYQELYISKLRAPFTMTWSEVATHNHFVLDRGGKVFKQTAPVIKLPAGATEDDHLALIGLLNSSTACFWLKQVCHNKGSTVDTKGARQTTDAFENFYAFNGTKVGMFPVADEKPLDLARELDRRARELAACSPAALLAEEEVHHEGTKRTKEDQSRKFGS